jgi:PAS domain S-box-containing protein
MLDDHPSRTDALLRLLVDQSKEYAIIILDPDGRIASWNRGAEAIFGVSRDEAVGRHASSLFTPEDVERGIPDHELVTAAADAAAEDDRWMERPNGSRFWATGVMRALRDDDGRTIGFGKILRNRTDLREQVETLRNQLDACEATHRRKDLFLSTLSHELRNPLAPLCNAVQLIRVTAPPAPEMEYSLKIIERQVENMRRLVDDLLDVTRIHPGASLRAWARSCVAGDTGSRYYCRPFP